MRLLQMNGIIRIVGYLVAGMANTLFGYLLFAMLVLLGLSPLIAIPLSAIGGTVFNFQTIGIVFGSRDPRLLPRFVLVYVGSVALNLTIIRLLLAAGVAPLLAQALCVLLLAPCGFLAMQRFVFRDTPRSIADDGKSPLTIAGYLRARFGNSG